LEKVEHASHILFVARMLGGEKSLTGAELARLSEVTMGYENTSSEERSTAVDASEHTLKQLIREVLSEKLKTRGA